MCLPLLVARGSLAARGSPVGLIIPHVPSSPVADLRRSYTRGGLDEGDLAPTWVAQFHRWFTEAVAAGLTEPNAVVLATGGPSARTVLLKGYDERGLVVYSNLRSHKAREIEALPRAGLCFPWVDLERQVCVTGAVEHVAAAEADDYFASRPRGSQLGAWASEQSEVVADRSVLERQRTAAQQRFPASAPVPRPPHWGGLRIVPDSVEFWQGRTDRLHDRLRFRRTTGAPSGWVVERLSP